MSTNANTAPGGQRPPEISDKHFWRWQKENSTISWDPEDGWVPYGGNNRYLLPRRFTVSIDTDRYPARLELTIEVDPETLIPECTEIKFSRHRKNDAPANVIGAHSIDGPRLTAESLRVPLATLVRQAVVAAGMTVEPDASGQPVIKRIEGDKEQAQDFFASYREVARVPRRGVAVTDGHLANVAEVYRAAVKRGEPPTKTVAHVLGCSRSTAGAWVMEARKRGLLGPALKRRAGERSNPKEADKDG